MIFLVARPVHRVYLLRNSSVFGFAELSFSETLSPHGLSFTLPSTVGPFPWQMRPLLLPGGPLGRSMQWGLLLIWAQGLRQAAILASGAVTGRIITTGNISAEEGGSVTLQCHLSSTTATVTQVDWKQQDRMLAIYHTNLGWRAYPAFRERVALGPNLDLTLRSLTTNDTGEYSCIYHTFPDGMYKGRLFLEVLQSSGAEQRTGFQILLLGVILLVVICTAVTAVVALTRKRKFLRIRSAGSGIQRALPEQEEWGPRVLSSPGSCVQAGAMPAGLSGEPCGDDYAEPHDYFNILSYRSLGDISFPAETG
ncbi:T-cell immunoreceptor with Ig and ITIM domains [Sturnira hondurensis]|uniref:T-cell immunoreceptor with Ig and ITIM domains n=1 Tax=Sturnira hondurensis TaxID=192404 RepID=UPI001879AEA7|nr:T-cell immunoreceptor with Ig and ITIM domains [Sturnira hondurensis]